MRNGGGLRAHVVVIAVVTIIVVGGSSVVLLATPPQSVGDEAPSRKWQWTDYEGLLSGQLVVDVDVHSKHSSDAFIRILQSRGGIVVDTAPLLSPRGWEARRVQFPATSTTDLDAIRREMHRDGLRVIHYYGEPIKRVE